RRHTPYTIGPCRRTNASKAASSRCWVKRFNRSLSASPPGCSSCRTAWRYRRTLFSSTAAMALAPLPGWFALILYWAERGGLIPAFSGKGGCEGGRARGGREDGPRSPRGRGWSCRSARDRRVEVQGTPHRVGLLALALEVRSRQQLAEESHRNELHTD